jgi:RecB family endonuclease NucS
VNQILKIFQHPHIKQAVTVINEALKKKELLVLWGNLSVTYSGRASSKLELGERVVMIKTDGSFLIHRSQGHSPVNWQPPGSKFIIKQFQDNIMIESLRTKPKERIKLSVDRVDLIVISKLQDNGEFSLYVTETDIRDMICFEPQLFEEGFRVILKEKKLQTGFIDLFGVDKENRATIIEIKRGVAGKDAVIQLERYINLLSKEGKTDFRGVLLAFGLGRGCQEMLDSLGLEFKRLYPKRFYEIKSKYEKNSKQKEISEWLKPF